MKFSTHNIQVLVAFVSVFYSFLAVVGFSSPSVPPPATTTSKTATTSDDTTCLNNDMVMTKKSNSSNNSSMLFRRVKRVLPRPYQHWVGNGFHVYPVFADLAFKEDLSPLLMFDYAAPKKFPSTVSTRPKGVGKHPHRGFETVTIAFQGEVEHRDNKGHSGVIGPGDVQWMTAGRGIVHEEYHSQNFTKEGGTLEMCQLWVNLPKKYKMTKPRYQAILKEQIPTVTLPIQSVDSNDNNDNDGDNIKDDGETKEEFPMTATVRLIAGGMDGDYDESHQRGGGGAAKTFSPVQMWDVQIPFQPRTYVDIPFPPNQNCIVFVRQGGIHIGEDDGGNNNKRTTKLGPQDVAIMHRDGIATTVRVYADEPDTSLLIMGGQPLDEPIAAQGPFVMNTRVELQQAMVDYQSGKF